MAHAGQLTFATPELLKGKGVNPADAAATAPWAQTELLVSLDDITAAFWLTEDGAAMRDRLDHRPFDKCAGNSATLTCSLSPSLA